MAMPPEEHRQREQEEEEEDSDEFTFPTPPPPAQLLAHGAHGRDGGRHLPCSASASSSPPVWLLSTPIRRSFSAADCAASPWRDRVLLARQRLNGACSPALSDYAGGFCDDEEEEEERMDSLWEDLNDDDAAATRPRNGDLFLAGSLDVSRRRSVAGGPDAAERARRAAKDQRAAAAAAAAVLGASRSSRRRPPGLVVMMRALRRMFVAHKGKSRVHRDEQSAASASASSFQQ